MTTGDFYRQVNRLRRLNNHWSDGRCWAVGLMAVNQPLYIQVANTDLDPWDNDDAIADFVVWVETNWK